MNFTIRWMLSTHRPHRKRELTRDDHRRKMALAVAATTTMTTTTTTTSRRDGSALQLPTQYFFWFYPPAVPAFLSHTPPCSSPGHLTSHMHSSAVVLPLLLGFAPPPRPNRISARLCNRQVASARNGQWAAGNETCKSSPRVG